MKEKQILVIIKKPGEAPVVEPLFDNTLEAFQQAVGGYIETITFARDACLVINEEGRLMGLPHNCDFCGTDLVGTVIALALRVRNLHHSKQQTFQRSLGLWEANQ